MHDVNVAVRVDPVILQELGHVSILVKCTCGAALDMARGAAWVADWIGEHLQLLPPKILGTGREDTGSDGPEVAERRVDLRGTVTRAVHAAVENALNPRPEAPLLLPEMRRGDGHLLLPAGTFSIDDHLATQVWRCPCGAIRRSRTAAGQGWWS